MSALATHGSRATQHLGFEPRAGVSPACNAAECSDAAPRSNPPTETAIQPAAGQAAAGRAEAYGYFPASTRGLGTSVAARCSSESWACTSTWATSSRTHPSGTPTPSALSGTPAHRRACSCSRLAPAAEAATRTSCASGRLRWLECDCLANGAQARLTAASEIVRTEKSLLIGQGVNNSCSEAGPRVKRSKRQRYVAWGLGLLGRCEWQPEERAVCREARRGDLRQARFCCRSCMYAQGKFVLDARRRRVEGTDACRAIPRRGRSTDVDERGNHRI